MLEVDLSKRRRGFTVRVSFTLPAGGKLALFGGSGEGKSTVLSCLAGIERPDSGRIVLDNCVLHPPPRPLHERGTGYLTQQDHLFPHLTAGENVLFSLNVRTRVAERAWLEELRERLGLAPLWNARVSDLSGGQARRTALARMLARKPRLVLLDEPFAGLDRAIVRELIEVLNEWQRTLGFTLVAVDHQANILRQMCPEALVLERGLVIQRGAWEQLQRNPASGHLASLLAPG
ncbi:MAG: ATP-binding cassette domain-containing protein [Acidiferrobacteraceae bacterium]